MEFRRVLFRSAGRRRLAGDPYDNWRLLVRARALDGVRWAVGTGRTGRRDVDGAPVTDYAGRSLVARPDGGIRAELDTDERDLVVDLEADVLERQRNLVGVFD